MNFYNPYLYSIPTSIQTPRVGLFSRLLGGNRINFSSILNGTQRALNFANQAIPLVKQVKPMIGNAKTMFKVMNEFKRIEKPINKNINIEKTQSNTKENNIQTNINEYDNGPTFFI